MRRLYDKDLLIAVPDALTKNAMLQSFELEVNDNMGDASGVAIAKALQHSATLQSFRENYEALMLRSTRETGK